jgi:hypothetical protein
MLPLPESIGKLAGHDQLRHLRFAHDQLRAVFDGFVIIGKAPGERVTRIVDPLDDFEQLAAEEIDQSHKIRLGGRQVARHSHLRMTRFYGRSGGRREKSRASRVPEWSVKHFPRTGWSSVVFIAAC